jgi:hypothetical protein
MTLTLTSEQNSQATSNIMTPFMNKSKENLHLVHCLDYLFSPVYIITNEDINNFKKYLYDINLKTCSMIKDFVIFLEQNINSFKPLFQSIIIDKIDEIEDIEIDNPSIIEIIKLFI